MKKVAFMDSWARSIYFFIPLHKVLNSYGYETLFIHMGSLAEKSISYTGITPEAPKPFEIRAGLRCYDITYFRTSNVYKILRAVNPDVVVLSNITHLPHRIFIRACQRLGIPVVYVMHGIKLSAIQAKHRLATTPSLIAMLPRRTLLQKADKYMRLLTMYFRVLSLAQWIEFLPYMLTWLKQLLTREEAFFALPAVTIDSIPDVACVYSFYDLDVMKEVYHVPPERIKIVGNIYLSNVSSGSDESLNARLADVGLKEGNYALFIHHTIAEDREVLTKFLCDLGHHLKERRLNLVLKVHPRTKIENEVDTRKLEGQGIIIINDIPITNLIQASHHCYGMFSTANIECLFFDKPIITIDFLRGAQGLGLFSPIAPTWTAQTRDELYDLTDRVVEGRVSEDMISQYRELKQYFLSYHDNRAIERIAQEVISLASTKCYPNLDK